MDTRRLATFVATLAFLTATVVAESSSDYRLPKDITPNQYFVSLNIDPEADGFSGSVVIRFTDNDAMANIRHFQINSNPKYVTVSSIIVNGNIDCSFVENEKTNIIDIDCPQTFSDAQNYATIVFASKYAEQGVGMYKGSYSENGTTKWFVSTQFQPEYARWAIPCLDEPAYKAIFNLNITAPSDYKVLSNTEVDFHQVNADTVTYYFKSTPKMSTYLLAIIVSKFESVTGLVEEYKVFARPAMLQYTSTAVHYGQLILSMLGLWLLYPYSALGISKSYQIAEPNKDGDMENWGAVTYAEFNFLDTGVNNTSVAQTQEIFMTMSHELSHQWFGDYVTAKWRSEIWLNEGFATYFQYFLSDEIDSTFELGKTFVTASVHNALVADSYPVSLPVVSKEEDIYTPANASRKFDAISYDKGGALFTFIAYFLGEANLRKGLVNYLQTWNLSNSNTESFLSIMATTANVSHLPEYLETWLYEPGYPVVNVSLTASENQLTFTQQRFFAPGHIAISNTEWYVPLSYTFSNNPDFSINAIKTWLEPGRPLSIEYAEENGWVVVNLQQLGFYRVNYDETLWKKLAEALKQNVSQIHATNRAQILDDVFTLAKADYVNFSLAFELVLFLKDDSSYHSWYVGEKHLTSLFGVGDEEDDDNLRSLIMSLVQDQLQIPDDSQKNPTFVTNRVEILGQALLLQTACSVGHSGCVAYAQEQFEKLKDGSSLDPNFKETIICTALQNSETLQEDYDFIFNLMRTTDLESEKFLFASALACVPDDTVIREFLTTIFNDLSILGNKKAHKIFTYVYGKNPNGPNVTLDFILNNTSEVMKHFTGKSQLSALITGLATKLNTDYHVQKLLELNKHTSIQDLPVIIQQAVDRATSNQNWLASHKSILKAALKAK